MNNLTFAIIKPDAVKSGNTGLILDRIIKSDFKILGAKLIRLSRKQAEGFYEVHRGRPFFDELCDFMTSEPVVVQVLEGEGAVGKNRAIMGATNPEEAEKGTIREEFALSVGENSVHGSDSIENAEIEINFFFRADEIVG